MKLDRYMASSSLSCWPELKSFCIGMDGRGLVSFLCQHTEEHDFMCSAVSDALELAPDPAKLVLDVLPGFHRSNDYFKGLPLPNVRRSCILLLEQLMTVSLQIEPSVSEEALKLAIDWKEKVAQKYPTAVTVYGLLQFIVTYRLVSAFDAYELVGFLVRASEHKQSPDLCLALGLEDKIPSESLLFSSCSPAKYIIGLIFWIVHILYPIKVIDLLYIGLFFLSIFQATCIRFPNALTLI